MLRGEKMSGTKYCGLSEPYEQGMNWHGAELGNTGRSYRCTCMPEFRLGENNRGPKGFKRRKARYKDQRQYNIGKYLPGFN